MSETPLFRGVCDPEKLSSLALAHVGDAVYDLLVRTRLTTDGSLTAVSLHKETVARVNARAQHEAAEHILSVLTEEESAVYRRARNTKVHSVPKNASLADYHSATGLEALFGWLWLKGMDARINELFELITEKTENGN